MSNRARKSLLALGIAASLVWTGCQPAAQSPAGTQGAQPAVPTKGGAMLVPSTLGDELMRARLLMTGLVQKDLGLTAEQVGKLRDCLRSNEQLSRDSRTKLREVFPPSQTSFPPEELEAKKQAYRSLSEHMKSEGKKLRAQALAVLTTSQSKRLQQIELQATNPSALTRPDIISALDISVEQRAKIRVLLDQMGQKQAGELPDLDGINPKDRRQKVIEWTKRSDELRREAAKRALDMLTPQQRAKLDTLLGKKIDATRLNDALIALVPEDPEFWSKW